jgi:hypothetical protein
MNNFHVHPFLAAFEHVVRVRGRIENATPAGQPRREKSDVIEFFSKMDAVVHETAAIHLELPLKYAKRLLERAEKGATYA